MFRQLIRKISLKGIITGSILGYVAYNIFVVPFAWIEISKIGFTHIPKHKFNDAYMQAVYNDPIIFLMTSMLGGMMSVFSGYLSAKIAKRNSLLNGMLATVPSLMLAAYYLGAGKIPGPLWMHIILIILTLFFGLLGGALRSAHTLTAGTTASINSENMDALSVLSASSIFANYVEGFLSNIVSGFKLLIFMRVDSKAWRATIPLIGGLFIFVSLINIGAEYLEDGAGSSFDVEGLPRLFAVLGIAATSILLSLSQSQTTNTNKLILPTILVSLFVPYDLLIRPIPWLLYDSNWFKRISFQNQIYFYYLLSFWLFLAFYVGALRAWQPRKPSGRALFLIYTGLMASFLYYFPPRGVWIEPRISEAQKSPEDQKRTDLLDSGDILQLEPDILRKAIDNLKPRQPNHINSYFIGIAPYSYQDIFMKEVQTVSNLFAKNFHTDGHALLLINNIHTADTLPVATNGNIRWALKQTAQHMDRNNDVLILYLTSHGSKNGLAMNLTPFRMKSLTPETLKSMLNESGIVWRIIIISGCYSGVFMPALQDEHTLVMTASDEDRTSFGCSDEGEMTNFPKALIVEHLVKTHDFVGSFFLAKQDISTDEKRKGLPESHPQINIGKRMFEKLNALKEQATN